MASCKINKWRRERDSNPRSLLQTLNGFQDRRIQPLCHLSVSKIETRRVMAGAMITNSANEKK